jgi:hypothetical protein
MLLQAVKIIARSISLLSPISSQDIKRRETDKMIDSHNVDKKDKNTRKVDMRESKKWSKKRKSIKGLVLIQVRREVIKRSIKIVVGLNHIKEDRDTNRKIIEEIEVVKNKEEIDD